MGPAHKDWIVACSLAFAAGTTVAAVHADTGDPAPVVPLPPAAAQTLTPATAPDAADAAAGDLPEPDERGVPRAELPLQGVRQSASPQSTQRAAVPLQPDGSHRRHLDGKHRQRDD